MLRLTLIVAIVLLAILPLVPQHAGTAGSLRRLTNTTEQSLNLNPTLSDDGTVVVFESTADLANVGNGNSFHTIRSSVSVDGQSLEEIAASRAVSPSISTDGRRIAFASTEDLVRQNADQNSEIYFFDGDQLQQLTHTTPDGESSRLIDGNFEPSISGDGRWVAYSSNRNLATSNSLEVFLVDTASRSSTQLTTSSNDADASKPKISSDASRIYFIQTKATAEDLCDLMLYNAIERSTRVLVPDIPGLSVTRGRAISSDGNRIVYSAQTGENQTQVFLFDVRENVPRQLTQLGTRSSDVDLNPTISGDGKRVTFGTRRKVTNASDGSVELYLIDLPTGTTEQITAAPSSATAEITSSLNHDGSTVVFSFPRVLSGPVSDSDFANNCEIYFTTLNARPQSGQATVANVAATDNSEPEVAPDSIAVIRSSNLSARTEQAKLIQGSLPFSIGGATVQVNGEPARLLYASPDEIIFVVPSGLADGPTEFVVINSEGFPSKAQAAISRAAPGLFSIENDAVTLNADTFLAAPFDPSNGQLRLAIFATGVRHASQLVVTIGGEAVQVEAVLPSLLPGLDEIHVSLPAQLRGAGTVPLAVKADGNDSNVVATSISGSALRDIMINEILVDPPDGLAGDANHDGTRDSSADEFIELINSTTRDLNLTGYQIQTRTATATADTLRHRFPAGTILQAGTALVVFGGGTVDNTNPTFGGAQIYRASTSGLSLSNSGGVVTIRDVASSVVTSVTYGASAGIPSDANQSITRSPDVVGSFLLHQTASGSQGSAFSPGTRVDGLAFRASPAVSSVTISPLFAELVKAGAVQFSAKAFDDANQELGEVIFSWTSSNELVLTVDSNGLARAISGGHAEVTAVGRGVHSAPASINVVVPTPSPTSTPTPPPTPTPTPTPSPSPSPSPISSPSPSPSPTATPTPLPALPLVISELRTRGPNGASDEFIEIYNNSETPIDASGLKLRGSSSGGSVTTKLTIVTNTLIPAHGHFLATNPSGYSGTVAGDQQFTSGIANDGGVALTMSDDTIIDQVGLSPGSAFKEGMHLAPLPSDANQSYERKPGGASGSTQDTEDNFTDFQLLTPSDPQNTQSNPTPGTIPSPSPTPSATPTASPSPVPSTSPTPSPTPVASRGIVISQVFGGGGNSGAPFRNDFIEIFNAGGTAVNLSGWSLQYASATAATWSVTSLSAIALAPGQYYLIQEASSGSNGVILPTPDTTGTIALAATAGKVALVRSATALSGVCPSDANIVDLVGYGSSANCFEGAAPAPAPSNSTAIVRNAGGCTDSTSNASDFTTTQPSPRNTLSALHLCSGATASAFDYWIRSALNNVLWIVGRCRGAPTWFSPI